MHELQRHAVVAAELVRVMQTFERVDDDAQVQRQRERRPDLLRAANGSRERLAFQVFHHDHVTVALRADLVRLNHVRMVQLRGESSLVQEHREGVRLARQIRQKRFQHDELVHAARAARDREVHVRHAAATELGENAVATDPHRRSIEMQSVRLVEARPAHARGRRQLVGRGSGSHGLAA
jgi:hypothetical protein